MHFWDYLLFGVLILALGYKALYHYRLGNTRNLPFAVYLINKYSLFAFSLLIPLKQNKIDVADALKRKKANEALLIFYICFALLMLSSVLSA
jgi:hypothetical protein